ncbi:MAG: phosphonate ABC transporter substrate-binding protein [Cyanobacteria bacterium SBLK]|nr:phosphonate ABC transporter substrate-binding protein [Cyanobacteria bacterium SBLK]
MQRRFLIKSVSLFLLSVSGAKFLSACSNTDSNPDASETSEETIEVKELNFGIISTESQANQKPIWKPFIEAMSEELGMPVKAFYATQYAGVIEAMKAKKVDLAWYGGKSYIEAAKRANAEAFVQTVALDGSKGYYSYLITNKDNPILSDIDIDKGNGDEYTIENAAQLTFAFNDPNSTSGFLVPSYYVFAQNKVNPKEAFERLVFSGSHEATALAVANNQVDVATNNNESLSRLEKTDAEARERIEVIWTSPVIPSDPIAYRKDLPESLKEKLQDFFYNYQDRAILDPLEWLRFDPAKDEDWNTIRELDFAKQILEVETNEDLSEEDKKKQLDELNKALDALK